MTWIEKFDKTFIPNFKEMGIPGEYPIMHLTVDATNVKTFIQTEIIEELINEIPDESPKGLTDCRPLKERLRAEWLKE